MVGFLAVLIDMISLATFQRTTNTNRQHRGDKDDKAAPLARRR